jgi:Leishmanolysin
MAYSMFLTTFILAVTAGPLKQARSMPYQKDIDFCKQVKLVPLKVGVWDDPDEFPAVYMTAMNDLWFYLFTAVKVRDSDSFVDMDNNLMLQFKMEKEAPFIAAASPKHRDRCGRPRIGSMSWNLGHLKLSRKEFILVLLHEVMHLMGGFSSYDAPFYFFFGKPSTESGLIDGYIKRDGDQYYAVSPGVLAEVHKVNPKLIGAPMECEEKNGMIYPDSHWHNDLFKDQIGCDLMLPFANPTARLSPVTVAMINDFGWYEIDYAQLDHLLESKYSTFTGKEYL